MNGRGQDRAKRMRKNNRGTSSLAELRKQAAELVEGGPAEIQKLTPRELLELISGLLASHSKVADGWLTLPTHPPTIHTPAGFLYSMYEESALGYQALNADGNILDVNQAWLTMLGYERSQVVGKPLSEFIPETLRESFAESFEAFKKAGAIHGVELELIRRDESHLFASVDGKISRDDNGEFQSTHCVLRDITGQRQAEEALRESEQRLALAIEGAGLAWWDQNLKTGEVRRSPLWAEMLGYTPEEIEESFRSFKEMVHPDDLPTVVKMANDHEAGRIPEFRAEHRMRTRDGEWRWVLNWGKVIERDEDGEPIRAAGVHLDVTDLKTAEEELRIKNEAIEMSITGHGITDTEGELLYVNDSLVRMWGYESKDEMIGRYLPEFWHGDRVYETMKALMESGGVIGEDTGRRKDGSTFPVDFTATLLKDEYGRPALMFGSFVDITERKRTEAALAESEKRYRTLQANLPVGVFRSTPEGRIVSANDAMVRMYGYDDVEDLMKVRSVDFYCDPRERLELERRLKRETSVTNHECQLKRKDGSVMWVSTSIYAHKDGKGRIVHYDGIDFDITGRKETEQALHLKNVALREVLGQFELERLDIGRSIKSNLDRTVAPLLASLRHRLDESDSLLLRQVERNLTNLVSPFIRDLETQFASLSPRELEICAMIRNGSSSKEIAAQLRISAETVHKFRHLIRKKLGITNQNVNLTSFLKTCEQKQPGFLGEVSDID